MWHCNMQGGRGGMEAGPAAAAGLVARLASALLGEGPALARALSADRRAFLQALALLQVLRCMRAHIIWLVIGLYQKMWAHTRCSRNSNRSRASNSLMKWGFVMASCGSLVKSSVPLVARTIIVNRMCTS